MPSRSRSPKPATAAISEPDLAQDSPTEVQDDTRTRESSTSVRQDTRDHNDDLPSSVEPSIDGYEEPRRCRKHHRGKSDDRRDGGYTSQRPRTQYENTTGYHEYHECRRRHSSAPKSGHTSSRSRRNEPDGIIWDKGRVRFSTERQERSASLSPRSKRSEVIVKYTSAASARETRLARDRDSDQNWIPGIKLGRGTRHESPTRIPKSSGRRKKSRSKRTRTEEEYVESIRLESVKPESGRRSSGTRNSDPKTKHRSSHPDRPSHDQYTMPDYPEETYGRNRGRRHRRRHQNDRSGEEPTSRSKNTGSRARRPSQTSAFKDYYTHVRQRRETTREPTGCCNIL